MTEPNFDRVAKVYRWAEYLSLGGWLQRTRLFHLRALSDSRSALLLGDGDGRFTGALLRENPELQAVAVDSSLKMLAQVRRNTADCGERLRTVYANALRYNPEAGLDLVVSHFFLDCFAQEQVDGLVMRIAKALPVGGLWLFSDFRVPPGALRVPATIYIRGLYLGFRVLTGLRVTRVPDHARPMLAAGLEAVATKRFLFGMLTTEIWRKTR